MDVWGYKNNNKLMVADLLFLYKSDKYIQIWLIKTKY